MSHRLLYRQIMRRWALQWRFTGLPAHLQVAVGYRDLSKAWRQVELWEYRPTTPAPPHSEDAHCLACGFEMIDGRYVGLCPKCGSENWYQTRIGRVARPSARRR